VKELFNLQMGEKKRNGMTTGQARDGKAVGENEEKRMKISRDTRMEERNDCPPSNLSGNVTNHHE
jgi:hypothetical protein